MSELIIDEFKDEIFEIIQHAYIFNRDPKETTEKIIEFLRRINEKNSNRS